MKRLVDSEIMCFGATIFIMQSQKLLPFIFYLFTLLGCATVPTKEHLPVYNIDGITYMPLVSLCELKGIGLDYDTYTRAVTLNKDTHRINLMVGQRQMLLDGELKNLEHPPIIYKGAVAVPRRFKEEIIDNLFKESPSQSKTVLNLSPIKKIVIDAGHGGTDPGAIGRSGLREKIVNLDIAKRLERLLRAAGFDVVMTRSSDVFIPLERRVEIANNAQADLFISIHTNANRVKSLNGFEVYYISPNIDIDSKRAMDTARNAQLKLSDAYFASDSLELKAILWDMIYTSNRKDSFELARSVCRMANSDLDVKILGIKGANFYVLKGARMPAVLIEVGFVSNYDEECKLRNNYYRQQIAEAVKQGIQNYAKELVLAQVSLNE